MSSDVVSGTATREAVYQECMSLTPQTGSGNQSSWSERNWIFGSFVGTRYNHIMPSNSRSCSRGSGDTTVNEHGGATTASSRHPGGLNLCTADGATHFINADVDI